MKAFIAFTIMLLAASSFELSEDISEEFVDDLMDALDNEVATKEVMASGQVEVVALPDHFLGVDKKHDADARVHAKHVTFVKTNLGTVPKACTALKTAFTAKPTSVCSYIDLGPLKSDAKYGAYAKYGKIVWCFDRMEIGNGAKFHEWDKTPAAAFFLGYML